MKKKSENANVNVKEKKVSKPKTSKKQEEPKKEEEPIKKLEDRTVRDLNTEKSILDDLGILEKLKQMKEENIRFNKRYGFDVPFINEMMDNFNAYLNKEGSQFLKTADESLKESEESGENIPNLFIKLIIENQNERILFKELLMTSERYPIYITIGDYDFFFVYFDEEQDPIFSFSKENFSFFFSNDLDKMVDYLKKSKMTFNTKHNRTLSFDGIKVKFIENKIKEEPKPESEPESPTEELNCENLIPSDYRLKNTYKVKLIPMIEGDEPEVFVVTDKPGEIFNYYGVDSVQHIKLIGNGISI